MLIFAILILADWLLMHAPQYYDLDNFPQCEARRALENVQAKREMQQNKYGAGY